MQIFEHEHEISAGHGFVEDVGLAYAEVTRWGGQWLGLPWGAGEIAPAGGDVK